MAISAAKLEANRRNARKSTGPRTEKGKRRSRLNAVTHGLRAEILVLLDEDQAEGRKKAWRASLLPRDDVEQTRSMTPSSTRGCETGPGEPRRPGWPLTSPTRASTRRNGRRTKFFGWARNSSRTIRDGDRIVWVGIGNDPRKVRVKAVSQIACDFLKLAPARHVLAQRIRRLRVDHGPHNVILPRRQIEVGAESAGGDLGPLAETHGREEKGAAGSKHRNAATNHVLRRPGFAIHNKRRAAEDGPHPGVRYGRVG